MSEPPIEVIEWMARNEGNDQSSTQIDRGCETLYPLFGWYILGKLLVDCSLLADGFLGCDRWLVRFLVPGGRGFLFIISFCSFFYFG